MQGQCSVGQRSSSTARSQVWLGLPDSRFQSGGSPRIIAATARWWSSCGELRAIYPKSRKRLSVTRWERGRHPVVALTSTFVTWRVYGILAHGLREPYAEITECCSSTRCPPWPRVLQRSVRCSQASISQLRLYKRVHRSRGIVLWLVMLIFNAVIGGYLQMK